MVFWVFYKLFNYSAKFIGFLSLGSLTDSLGVLCSLANLNEFIRSGLIISFGFSTNFSPSKGFLLNNSYTWPYDNLYSSLHFLGGSGCPGPNLVANKSALA